MDVPLKYSSKLKGLGMCFLDTYIFIKYIDKYTFIFFRNQVPGYFIYFDIFKEKKYMWLTKCESIPKYLQALTQFCWHLLRYSSLRFTCQSGRGLKRQKQKPKNDQCSQSQAKQVAATMRQKSSGKTEGWESKVRLQRLFLISITLHI